ncbi:MAG: 50S ribosomal protein L11 methyltransferase [Zoogloeaceae bacterium]|jgi:ribosomal protein L11 methyltransferase|nr:50S ribosomal protein L11 methyltransferase [Zoogloeaceae bacterium]
MTWISAAFLTNAARAEAFCDALLEVGALSASMEDADAGTPEEKPQFGEPDAENAAILWEHTRIVALFAKNAPIAHLMEAAAKTLCLPATPVFTLDEVEEENWVARVQAQFAPIRISERLWIVPSWHESPDKTALNLRLNPGMAFGTGSHPTTRLCLEWLERENPAGKTVLDYGCGSGILAIAAAKLGATRITGVDIDPQAIVTAVRNAEKNAVAIDFHDLSVPLVGDYDQVLANILANPLRMLAPALSTRVRPGGSLALSGILLEQATELVDIYAPWIPLVVTGALDGWALLSGVKPSC